jgi:hypothetical protein
MRRLGWRLLVTADVLAALAAAASVAVFYVKPGLAGPYDAATGTVQLVVRENTALELVFLIALALLVVNALYFLYGRRPSVPLQYVASEAPGGPMKVSREALEAGLRAAGESLDMVTRLRINVDHGGPRRIVVRAHFQSPEGASIPEASRALRAALAQRFQEMVHVTDGVKTDFDIEFAGFSGRLPPRKAEAEAEEDAESFTGPRYPIRDDDESSRGRDDS